MSWRTIMRAGKSPEEKFTEPTKPSTESTKPKNEDLEPIENEAFVDIVDQSEGSQNLIRDEPSPFHVGERVTYRVPDPMGTGPHPAWVEHTGKVLHVDSVGQAVCLQPEDEPGTPWRWLW